MIVLSVIKVMVTKMTMTDNVAIIIDNHANNSDTNDNRIKHE